MIALLKGAPDVRDLTGTSVDCLHGMLSRSACLCGAEVNLARGADRRTVRVRGRTDMETHYLSGTARDAGGYGVSPLK